MKYGMGQYHPGLLCLLLMGGAVLYRLAVLRPLVALVIPGKYVPGAILFHSIHWSRR